MASPLASETEAVECLETESNGKMKKQNYKVCDFL